MAAVDGRDPLASFRILNDELASYSEALRSRPQLLVANKMDLPQAKEHVRRFGQSLGAGTPRIWPISCVTGAGITELLAAITEELFRAPVGATQ
jgi:GTP-binding protein